MDMASEICCSDGKNCQIIREIEKGGLGLCSLALHRPMTSVFAAVLQAPEDPILGLNVAFAADTSPNKVNLGVGAYRTDEGKPWVLPVVRKVEEMLLNDKTVDKEYLTIDGLPAFRDAARRLILADSVPDNKVVTVQALSGTGALRIGFEFLRRFYGTKTPYKVYLPNPTWPNHQNIIRDSGLQFAEYRYFDPKTNGLDYAGLCEDLKAAPSGSVILLHACAHNPTGVDPNYEQWQGILDIIRRKQHFPFFDCAYQGFASGDLNKDAYAVRLFAKAGCEMLIAQSFAKNFGLYGERIGALSVVTSTSQAVEPIRSQLKVIIRPMYSNPPAHGAHIVAKILNDPHLFQEWQSHLTEMSGRITLMRQKLYNALKALGTPGDWSHILKGIGMFSYTGIPEHLVDRLVKEHHIYMLRNGRISMAGLNTKNIDYFAQAIHHVYTTDGSRL
jgi:aspartate aminotransferase